MVFLDSVKHQVLLFRRFRQLQLLQPIQVSSILLQFRQPIQLCLYNRELLTLSLLRPSTWICLYRQELLFLLLLYQWIRLGL
jgi:hypothetical protein